ncbi:hypothetical protein TNCT_220391 [Trichonephila clavata]|uniref:Uncharacterized protein n=1 Tax=Trichonephila clavata TaxID=2740835 RepID=A0A8X6FD95_TRICU|nr:hypothetical protein TNCT_220391 [Trichonephila clavata]
MFPGLWRLELKIVSSLNRPRALVFQKRRAEKKLKVIWIKNISPNYTKRESTASDLPETALKDETPSELFEQFYFSAVYDLIVKETR